MKAVLFSIALVAQSVYASDYGSYTVPVPTELAPYATFSLPDAKLERNATHVTLSYKLPAELVGADHEAITLKGKIRPGRALLLTGKYGDASCLSTNGKTECVVEYDDLEQDMTSAEAAIAVRTQDLAERAARLEVAKLFGSEPVGIVEIKLR